jgi:sugar lactone lactonase YvrE
VRRLLVFCSVTMILFAFVATERTSQVAAGQQTTANNGITSVRKTTVVAAGISARALSVNSSDPHAAIYLTNANAPNQIFTLGVVNLAAVSRANVQLAAFAGTGTAGSLGDGGAATAAQFDLSESSMSASSGVAVGPDGTTYVADTQNATIRAIAGPASTEPGIIRSIAGHWAPRQDVTLVEPMGIALDRAGNLYFTDHATGSVFLMAASGGQIETLAHLTSPDSIAVTPDGATVFVASPDTGTVFSIATQTREIQIVVGPQHSSSGRSNACAAALNAVSAPICAAGLAVDGSGNLYISDFNSGRIFRVSPQTAAITVTASGLNLPGALTIDAGGTLYAVEQGLNRIVAFAQVGTSQGSISLAPASAAFANEPVGGTTATQSFTLSNISSSAVASLTIPKATAPADFTIQSNACATTLAPSGSCTLSVAFTPTTSGARSGTLTVTDANASDSASTILTGTGDDFEIQLANNQLTSVSVQAGASATFNLDVVPDSVFSGTVTLVCPTNLPTNTTCAFSSPTVNVTAGAPAPFSVTFQTTGVVNPLTSWLRPSHNEPPSIARLSDPLWIVIVAAVLLLLAFGSIIVGRPMEGASLPAARAIGSICAILFLFAASAVVLAGCSKGKTPASIGATPAGTSTLAITGTSQNASRALTITLNVVTK